MMISSIALTRAKRWLARLSLFAVFFALASAYAWPFSSSLYVCPKFHRFEQQFESAVVYPNPATDATLLVTFISPLGDRYKVRGYWDGGKIWRVRFCPTTPGNWKYETDCSDQANDGLHRLGGEFLCTSAVGDSPFQKHGPLMVTRDRQHLEFADRTPFFWLADNAGNGALLAKPADWQFYALIRDHEDFNIAIWNADDSFLHTNDIVEPELPTIDRKAMKRMDVRLETVERVGLVNAIVPFTLSHHGESSTNLMSTDAAIARLRDLVARWGAGNVVWVLPCEAGTVNDWKKIGRAVFGEISHAPVVLAAGDAYWMLEEFRNEPWVDVFGYSSGQDVSEDALQWLLLGPVTKDWKREPLHAFINLAPPCENQWVVGPAPRASAQAVRRAAYWSALATPTAGVSYSAQGVWNWDTNVDAALATAHFETWVNWRKDLFLPASKQMGVLAGLFTSTDFARLRPAPELVARQPGMDSPARFIAAARTALGDIAVVYTPEGGTVELATKLVPPDPTATWINPRTGAHAPVEMIPGDVTSSFTAPDTNDWVLLLKTAHK